MSFDTGTIPTYRFEPHAEKRLVLQAFKNLVQNAGLVPFHPYQRLADKPVPQQNIL